MNPSTANSRTELQLAAAKFVLGFTQSWDIPPVADRAISNGEYSPALAELADLKNPVRADVEPLFVKALAEMGLSMRSRVDSAWLIARHCIEHIASKAESLRAALSLLKETSYVVRDVLPDKKYVGENLDLGSLIGIYWSYTEPDENCFEGRVITDEAERCAILDSLAREEAREWLKRHGLE
ncbi:MAG: hypothetical protein IT450_23030 [Phycisphaerales bacterium]|nr:hypothetical protein [Phycisphaerales bacterium]